MSTFLRSTHILALGIWCGTAAFFNGCVALRIFWYFGSLPGRSMTGLPPISADVSTRLAGDLIATLFPTYFAIQVFCGLLATGTALWLMRSNGRLAKTRAALLSIALIAVLLNIALLYRPSTAIRQEQYAAYDAGDMTRFQELRKRFFALHGPSLATDFGGTALILLALALTGPSFRPGTNRQS